MTKKILISMAPEVIERMKESAKAEGYTLSAFIRELYKSYTKKV